MATHLSSEVEIRFLTQIPCVGGEILIISHFQNRICFFLPIVVFSTFASTNRLDWPGVFVPGSPTDAIFSQNHGLKAVGDCRTSPCHCHTTSPPKFIASQYSDSDDSFFKKGDVTPHFFRETLSFRKSSKTYLLKW